MNNVDEEAKALFIRILGVDLKSATILVENGISSVEEVAYIPFDELLSIKELPERLLQTCRERAREYLSRGPFDDGEPCPSSPPMPLTPLAGGARSPIADNENNEKKS